MTMKRLLLLAVVVVLAFTAAGCDSPPLTVYELGPGQWTYFGSPDVPVAVPAVRFRAREVGQPLGVTCWQIHVVQHRHTLFNGDLYHVEHGIGWCEDAHVVTSIFMNYCTFTIDDDFGPILDNIGGIRSMSLCQTTAGATGGPLADTTATWHFAYSLVQSQDFVNIKDFWPRDHVILHPRDGSHGGLSYITGEAWNG